jgi:hypothetical protein
MQNDINVSVLTEFVNVQASIKPGPDSIMAFDSWHMLEKAIKTSRKFVPLGDYISIRLQIWKAKRRYDSPADCPFLLAGITFYMLATVIGTGVSE